MHWILALTKILAVLLIISSEEHSQHILTCPIQESFKLEEDQIKMKIMHPIKFILEFALE